MRDERILGLVSFARRLNEGGVQRGDSDTRLCVMIAGVLRLRVAALSPRTSSEAWWALRAIACGRPSRTRRGTGVPISRAERERERERDRSRAIRFGGSGARQAAFVELVLFAIDVKQQARGFGATLMARAARRPVKRLK